jgi:nucleoside 2-deoxyribosyltransferase
MKNMADHKVFISYSQPDLEWARGFADALRQRGVGVWFDQFEITPGENLRDALESGLRQSDVFVTLLNPKESSRPALFFELGAAIAMNKRVVAIVPKDVDAAQFPFELRLRKYLLRDSPEETADELSQALAAA